MYSYFIFDGINSRDRGIYLDAPAQVIRGKKRVTQVTVLGRPGALTLPEGDDVYEPYTQQLILRAKNPAQNVLSWLNGQKYVTFSTEPDKRQLAEVINQVSFKRVSYGLDWYEGTVQFLCQPLKELIHEPVQAAVNGTVFVNLGDTVEKPLITMDGAAGDFTVSMGGNTLAVKGLDSSYGGCIIDCDAGMLLSYDGTELLTALTEGDFPELVPGRNTVAIDGVTVGTVTVRRRQRWL